MTYFTIVLQQIIAFLIYASIGVVAVKTKILDKAGLGMLSRLITKIVLPLLVFTNIINGATRQQFIQLLPLLLMMSALMYILLYFLGMGMARLAGLRNYQANIYRMCVLFGNLGFMGIPIVQAILPEQGVLFVSLFMAVDQLMLWTLGVKLSLPVDNARPLTVKEIARKMVNPVTVAIAVAVLLVLFNLQLPELLNTALVKTGATATPLAMLYLGGLFCGLNLRECVKHKEIYMAVLVKMIAFPLLFLWLLNRIPGIRPELAMTLAILAGMPTMSSAPLLVKNHESDREYAAAIVFVTTVCCIVTIPLVCLFIG